MSGGVCAVMLPVMGVVRLGDRMEATVELRDSDQATPCWMWLGATSKGRPVLARMDRRYAHRIAWEYANGEVLDSQTPLMRQCPNSLCVNPGHYRLSRRILGLPPREPTPPEKQREWNLRRYGITPSEYDRLLAEQDGVCAVCKRDGRDRLGRRLHVDHDHETGRVRGLLCTRCNNAIGQAGEDADRLRAIADYLEASCRVG